MTAREKVFEAWYHSFTKNAPFHTNQTQIVQSFPVFNEMNDFHSVLDIKTDNAAIYFYQNDKVSQLSNDYGSLIALLESKEEDLLTEAFHFDVNEWKHFKSSHRKSTLSSKEHFESMLIDWFRNRGVASQELHEYLRNRKSKAINQRIFEAINQFNNPWNFKEGIPVYQKQGDLISNPLAKGQNLFVDFHSKATQSNFQNNWYEQIHSAEVPFFKSDSFEDFDTINQKAQQSTISVQAKLKGINQLAVIPADWFNERLVFDLLDNYQLNEGILNPSERKIHQSKLKHRIQKLYLINGFVLKIELMNQFTKAEFDILKSDKFKCFPFYFDVNVKYKQEVIHRADGTIDIYQQSINNEPIVVASALKSLHRH